MSESDFTWGLTEHLCQFCFGRVLVRRVDDSGGPSRVFRCSNCGVEAAVAAGQAHPPICACGMKIGARVLGLRCISNERPRPEMPGEIVVREVALTG